MKDAVFHLFILDCIVQTKVNDKQEKSKFAFFLKIKLFVILEYLEFQKERRKEKKTPKLPLTHDKVHGIVPPLSVCLRRTDPHSFRLTTSKTSTPGGNQGT